VDKSPGFEHFELLRPLAGTDQYLVYTRWESESHFNQWRTSREFTSGHSKAPRSDAQATDAQERPAASDATLWTFEVA
jgi:heme-degrading monooxygenase HmoA